MKTSPTIFLFAVTFLGSSLAFYGSLSPEVFWLSTIFFALSLCIGKNTMVQMLSVFGCTFFLAASHATYVLRQFEVVQQNLPAETVVFEGTLSDVWHNQGGSLRSIMQVRGYLDNSNKAVPYAANLMVHMSDGAAAYLWKPGDIVRIRGSARPFLRSLFDQQFDSFLYGLSQNVHGQLAVKHPLHLAQIGEAHSAFFFHTKEMVRNTLLTHLTPAEAGLLLALTVGDTSLFEAQQKEAYRHVGAGHLLAVSGLQVSLLGYLFFRCFLWLLNLIPRIGRFSQALLPATCLTYVAIWLFIGICGFPASAVRAGFMVTLMLSAPFFKKPIRAVDACSLAGLLTILYAPESVLDPGFVLSYSAVFGILFAQSLMPSPINNFEPTQEALTPRLLWFKRNLLFVLATSFITFLFTSPFSLLYFGALAPGGILANLILIPLAAVLQIPAIVLTAVATLTHAGFWAKTAALCASFIEMAVYSCNLFLGGLFYFSKSIFAAFLLLAVAMALLLCCVKLRRRLLLILISGFCFCFGLLGLKEYDEGLRITFLPVGHGDASLLELPDDRVILIDGGGSIMSQYDPGERILWPYLQQRHIKAIDVMVISHPDLDHLKGLFFVLDHLPVREIWHSGFFEHNPLMQQMLQKAQAKGIKLRTASELLGTHHFGEVIVDVLWPKDIDSLSKQKRSLNNDLSLVLRACYRNQCALWTGDIEKTGEAQLLASMTDIKAHVVKAPHHGSQTSSTAAFIEKSKAMHVVFSTEKYGRFRFPHKEVEARWQQSGAKLWNTASHGLLTFWLSGKEIVVEPFQRQAKTWPEQLLPWSPFPSSKE